jgi:methanethiol S-methyltransferase
LTRATGATRHFDDRRTLPRPDPGFSSPMSPSHALERVFVWAGGAVFVAALALTLYTYLVVFDRGGAFGDWRPLVVNLLLISGFALHHSLFARERVKTALEAVFPARLTRSLYVWVASVLLIGVCLAWQPVGGDFYRFTGMARAPFVLAEVIGVWMIGSAVRAIDALELAGIRESQIREDLQQDGAYGIVRHPLYLGWVLFVFGSSHMTGDRLWFAIVTTLYVCIAIPWEERSLERSYGESYRRYKRQVRWRVVPLLY